MMTTKTTTMANGRHKRTAVTQTDEWGGIRAESCGEEPTSEIDECLCGSLCMQHVSGELEIAGVHEREEKVEKE